MLTVDIYKIYRNIFSYLNKVRKMIEQIKISNIKHFLTESQSYSDQIVLIKLFSLYFSQKIDVPILHTWVPILLIDNHNGSKKMRTLKNQIQYVEHK